MIALVERVAYWVSDEDMYDDRARYSYVGNGSKRIYNEWGGDCCHFFVVTLSSYIVVCGA